jgi:hypothetical protein
MEMLHGGAFVPQILDDGTRVFIAPLGKGHVPIVSVVDIGYFVRYIFDHRTETSGKELRVRTTSLKKSNNPIIDILELCNIPLNLSNISLPWFFLFLKDFVTL